MSRNTTVILEAPYSSFPLGSKNCTSAINDFKSCSIREESYSKGLKLTGCGEGEVTCSDGQYIAASKFFLPTPYISCILKWMTVMMSLLMKTTDDSVQK